MRKYAFTLILFSLLIILPSSTIAQTVTTTIVVDDGGGFDTGIYTSMVVDANGLPIIAYSAYQTNGFDDQHLMLAYCNDLACTAPNIVTVDDSVGTIGPFNSMVLNDAGYPVIAYSHLSVDKIKLAVCNDATCSSPTINTINVDGRYNNLALDDNEYPIIATYDDGDDDLELIYCSDTTCTTTPTVVSVDTSGFTGAYAEMVLNEMGYPVIAYQAKRGNIAQPGQLVLAVCNDAICSDPTISIVDNQDISGARVSYSALALNSNGYPIIAYDATGIVGRPLKLAICDDAVCSNPTLKVLDESFVGASTTGSHASIVLHNDAPIIAYEDANQDDLKLAICNDPACATHTLKTLDSMGNVGRFISMIVDNGGNVAVAYHDDTNGTLKLYSEQRDGCYVYAPSEVTKGEIFTISIQCNNIDEDVAAFQVGHRMTGAARTTDRAYTPGTFAEGQEEALFVANNTLQNYVGAFIDGNPVSGFFTIGSVDYSVNTNARGGDTIFFGLTPFVLSDPNGGLVDVVHANANATITVVDSASFVATGTIQSSVANADLRNLKLTLPNGSLNLRGDVEAPYNFTISGGAFNAAFTAEADMHLGCDAVLTMQPNIEAVLGDITLTAGNVATIRNEPVDIIDINDMTAIGVALARGRFNAAFDVNSDDALDARDIAIVASNFGTERDDCFAEIGDEA